MIVLVPFLVGTAIIPPDEEQWETIIVTAEMTPDRVLPPHVEISEDALLLRQPRNVAEALRGLPGISANTNSRGETVPKLRGAEERQTQVFLDGAPLAIPWDGRADLGFLPANLIGAIRVTKGAVPIEFGTNAVAGAVDLETRSGGEHNLRASASAGTSGFADASFVTTMRAGIADVTLAAAGFTRDAEPVASHAVLPFGQDQTDERTNTDLDSGTLFGATRFEIGSVAVRAYILHLRGQRGIAPESDRDPAISSPRYWRYPLIEQTQASVSSTIELGSGSFVRMTGWQQWAGQQIDQYSDATYSHRQTREESADDTTGGRIVLATLLNPVTVRFGGTLQTSSHVQTETAATAGATGPTLTFRQNLYTFGMEADVPIGKARASVGLGYDRSENPLTGDKPVQAPFDAPAFSAAVRMPAGNGLTLTLSGGRRTRFPSSRELFGEALGRFVPNPDLQPETAWLADAELHWVRSGFDLSINPFFARIEDTISQRVIRVAGRSLRQRYNLSGSTRYGVDVAIRTKLTNNVAVEVFGTVLRARADSGDTAFRRLPQRPDYDIGAALSYEARRAAIRAELRLIGPAVDLDPQGQQATLPSGYHLNLRGRLPIARVKDLNVSLTGAVENITNGVILPQLGLPLAGRSLRIGFQLD